jgi:hypothetical protein
MDLFVEMLLPHHPINTQPQIPQLIAKCGTVQPQPFAGVTEVAVGFLQNAFEQGSFHGRDDLCVKVALAAG